MKNTECFQRNKNISKEMFFRFSLALRKYLFFGAAMMKMKELDLQNSWYAMKSSG